MARISDNEMGNLLDEESFSKCDSDDSIDNFITSTDSESDQVECLPVGNSNQLPLFSPFQNAPHFLGKDKKNYLA